MAIDNHSSGPRLFPAQKALAGLVFLLAAASLWLFLVRLDFALHNQYFTTSGCEGAPLYSIWKVQHGHPLYESARQSTLPLTVYNYLFYVVQGTLLRVLGCGPDTILPVTKLITCAFAVLGAFCQWRLLRLLLGKEPSPLARWAGLALVFVTWFGASTLSWWTLTARPDVPALAMTCAAMLWAVKAVGRQEWRFMVVASVLFYLGWAFKQAAIWSFMGTWFFLALYRRDWRMVLALSLPYGLLIITTLAVGGSEYAFTIIGIPSKSPIFLSRALAKTAEIIVPNLLFWGALPLVPRLWRTLTPDAGRAVPHLLFTVAVWSALIGMVAVGRDGSERNHLFEGLLWVCTLGAWLVVRWLEPGNAVPKTLAGVAAALAGLTLLLPAAQAVFPRVDAGYVHWNVTFADQESYAAKARLAAVVKGLPQPMLVMDDILAQPWFTTSNQYPAVVLDQWVYFRAQNFGLFQKEQGLPRLFQQHFFASLLLKPGNSLHRDAVAAGYQEIPLPAEQKGWVLMKRPNP